VTGEARARAAAPVAGRLAEGTAVYLRHPAATDRAEFLDRARASRPLHRPWVYAPEDDGSFDAYLRSNADDASERLLVCHREDGAIVGAYNLSQIFYGGFRNAYLSYYVFAPFGGRGYMRDGLRLVLRHAFGPLGLHRLEANIQPGNTASIALVRGAGFRREGFSPRYLKVGGRWRDHERWAILADDRPGSARSRSARS
jgi:ribosomal-protein-alanine N-acetyltransferase